MKNFIIIFLLLLMTAALATNDVLNPKKNTLQNHEPAANSTEYNYSDSIDNEGQCCFVKYKFDIRFNFSEKSVNVQQKMVWFNNSKIETDRILFALPLNSFQNNKTVYFQNTEFDPRATSDYKFKSILVDSIQTLLKIVKNEKFPDDNTLAELILPRKIGSSDSVLINMEYDISIPNSFYNFGYSKNGNFCLLADWHPYIIKYKEGDWLGTQRSVNFKAFAERSNFNAELNFPDSLTLITSADIISSEITTNKSQYRLVQTMGDQLSLAFYRSVNSYRFNAEVNDGIIPVTINLLDENERYLERTKKIVVNTLKYMDENFGDFPFRKLDIFNIPNEKTFDSRSFSSMIAVYYRLISPEYSMMPESNIASSVAAQYFEECADLCRTQDLWIERGIPEYISSKVLGSTHVTPYLYFNIAGYFPVYGLNLLSYNEIPIIYTVNKYDFQPGLKNISMYYEHLDNNPITSFDLIQGAEEFRVLKSIKPALVLNSLEKEIGEKRLNSNLKTVLNMSGEPGKTEKFINQFAQQQDPDAGKFLEDVFYKSFIYDYAVTGIKSFENIHDVEVSRLGSGTCPADVFLYTANDTLSQFWDGKEKKERITFVSYNKVIAAEIKPRYCSLLDINNANNSYTVDENSWGSLSLAIRTFFWFQNALMIFGSIG